MELLSEKEKKEEVISFARCMIVVAAVVDCVLNKIAMDIVFLCVMHTIKKYLKIKQENKSKEPKKMNDFLFGKLKTKKFLFFNDECILMHRFSTIEDQSIRNPLDLDFMICIHSLNLFCEDKSCTGRSVGHKYIFY